MWLEAVLTRDDFVSMLAEFLPVSLSLDEEDKVRTLWLGPATDITIVEGVGLRVACPAKLTWSLMGIATHISLETLEVMVRPEIHERKNGQALAFVMQLEEADISGVPALIDHTIMRAVNTALAQKELAWHFTRSLSRRVDLGDRFDPIDALSIDVAWGKERVSPDAIVLAISLRLGFQRRD
jgi:hypothetical protein